MESNKFLRCWLFAILVLSVNIYSQTRIAIVPFNYSGSDYQLRDFSRNLPDMLSTNLTESSSITIVERMELDKVINELHLQETNYIDNNTAVQFGRLAGATHVIVGAVTTVGKVVRIDARMISVERGESIISARAEGTTDNPFILINTLSARLLSSLTGEQKQFYKGKIFTFDRTFRINPAPYGVWSVNLCQNSEPYFNLRVETMHLNLGALAPNNPQILIPNIMNIYLNDYYILHITEFDVDGSVNEIEVQLGGVFYTLRGELIHLNKSEISNAQPNWSGQKPSQIRNVEVRISLTALQ